MDVMIERDEKEREKRMSLQDHTWPIREQDFRDFLCKSIHGNDKIRAEIRIHQEGRGCLYEDRIPTAASRGVMTEWFVGLNGDLDHAQIFDELYPLILDDLESAREFIIVYVRLEEMKPRRINDHPPVVLRRLIMEYDVLFADPVSGLDLRDMSLDRDRNRDRKRKQSDSDSNSDIEIVSMSNKRVRY
jgi:hypothetical protein